MLRIRTLLLLTGLALTGKGAQAQQLCYINSYCIGNQLDVLEQVSLQLQKAKAKRRCTGLSYVGRTLNKTPHLSSPLFIRLIGLPA